MRTRIFALITSLSLGVLALPPTSQAQSKGNNQTQTRRVSTTRASAAGAIDSSAVSPTDGVPLALFSMHIQSELFSGMPWPSVSFGSIRLWDTYTTWNDLNPSPGHFNWPALDRWLDAAQQHGVDVIYTFGATPTWASSNPTGKCDYNPGACYPMQDWDSFVRAIATHAAGRIKYWEMWNEANQHEYWSGGITALVTMTQHASAIIKSIVPNAMIFTPSGVGGAVDTSTFLDKFLAAGGGAFVDGVAFHGYVNSIPAIPEDVNRIVDHVENVMVARGQSGKPLWDTEGSWGPSEHLTGDDARMAFVARHYILQWSKLFKSSTGTLEKAGAAYAQVESWLVGANLTAPCSASRESTWTCDLTLAGGASGEIVWNAVVNIPATIPFTPASNFTQCTDLDGKVTQLSGGPIQIGGKPILLIGSRARHAPTKKSARNTVSRRVAERLKGPEMES